MASRRMSSRANNRRRSTLQTLFDEPSSEEEVAVDEASSEAGSDSDVEVAEEGGGRKKTEDRLNESSIEEESIEESEEESSSYSDDDEYSEYDDGEGLSEDDDDDLDALIDKNADRYEIRPARSNKGYKSEDDDNASENDSSSEDDSEKELSSPTPRKPGKRRLRLLQKNNTAGKSAKKEERVVGGKANCKTKSSAQRNQKNVARRRVVEEEDDDSPDEEDSTDNIVARRNQKQSSRRRVVIKEDTDEEEMEFSEEEESSVAENGDVKEEQVMDDEEDATMERSARENPTKTTGRRVVEEVEEDDSVGEEGTTSNRPKRTTGIASCNRIESKSDTDEGVNESLEEEHSSVAESDTEEDIKSTTALPLPRVDSPPPSDRPADDPPSTPCEYVHVVVCETDDDESDDEVVVAVEVESDEESDMEGGNYRSDDDGDDASVQVKMAPTSLSSSGLDLDALHFSPDKESRIIVSTCVPSQPLTDNKENKNGLEDMAHSNGSPSRPLSKKNLATMHDDVSVPVKSCDVAEQSCEESTGSGLLDVHQSPVSLLDSSRMDSPHVKDVAEIDIAAQRHASLGAVTVHHTAHVSPSKKAIIVAAPPALIDRTNNLVVDDETGVKKKKSTRSLSIVSRVSPDSTVTPCDGDTQRKQPGRSQAATHPLVNKRSQSMKDVEDTGAKYLELPASVAGKIKHSPTANLLPKSSSSPPTQSTSLALIAKADTAMPTRTTTSSPHEYRESNKNADEILDKQQLSLVPITPSLRGGDTSMENDRSLDNGTQEIQKPACEDLDMNTQSLSLASGTTAELSSSASLKTGEEVVRLMSDQLHESVGCNVVSRSREEAQVLSRFQDADDVPDKGYSSPSSSCPRHHTAHGGSPNTKDSLVGLEMASTVADGTTIASTMERSSESKSSSEAIRQNSIEVCEMSILKEASSFGEQAGKGSFEASELEGSQSLKSTSLVSSRGSIVAEPSLSTPPKRDSPAQRDLGEPVLQSRKITAEEIKNSMKKAVLRREGSIKNGRWKLSKKKIGQGAFGVVHLGQNTQTGELIAVKTIRMDPVPMAEAKREIQLLRSLKHPNIVRYIGAEMNQSHLNIFQEWVSTGSITYMLSILGPFSLSIVKSYLEQILLGLSYLHGNNIIHRDIKGSNILVSNTGVVKLADFGSGKQLVKAKCDTMMEMTCKGTPYFMAPEVFEEKFSMKADIWSAGCVVVQMMTGMPPWKDLGIQNPVSLFLHVSKVAGPPNIDYDEFEIDEHVENGEQKLLELKSLITKCFEMEPEKRPSAIELLSDSFIATDLHSDLDDPHCRTLFSPTPKRPTRECSQSIKSPETVLHKRQSSCDQLRSPLMSPPTQKSEGNVLATTGMFSPAANSTDWPSWAQQGSKSSQKGTEGTCDGSDSLAYSSSSVFPSQNGSSGKENSTGSSGSLLVGLSLVSPPK